MSIMITQPVEAPTISPPTNSSDQLPDSNEHPTAEQVEDNPEEVRENTQIEPENDVVEAEISESIRPSMVFSLVTDEKKAKIYDMHNLIQTTIGQIQDKTQQILQDQERDLIRAFRLRLTQVQEDLEKERKKNESGSAEWVVRCHKLTEELEWLRELTDKLTTENNLFIQENQRYARQLAAQDQDRSFMLRQLVAAKKENARLRLSLESLDSDSSTRAATTVKHGGMLTDLPYPQLLDTPLPIARAGVVASTRGSTARADTCASSRSGKQAHLPPPEGHSAPPPEGSRQRAAAVADARAPTSPGGKTTLDIDSLRARVEQLEQEKEQLAAQLPRMRKALHASEERARQFHAQVMALASSRAELTAFFHHAVDDVRADIAARRAERARAVGGKDEKVMLQEGSPVATAGPSKPPVDPRSIPCSAFSVRDRVHVLEWMLTQDHVVRIIFDAIFPPVPPTPQARTHAREATHDTLARIPRAASTPQHAEAPSSSVSPRMPLSPRPSTQTQGAPTRAATTRTRTQPPTGALVPHPHPRNALPRSTTFPATHSVPTHPVPMAIFARSLRPYVPVAALPLGVRPHAASAASSGTEYAHGGHPPMSRTRISAHTGHPTIDLSAARDVVGAGVAVGDAWGAYGNNRSQDAQESMRAGRPAGIVTRAQRPLWASQTTRASTASTAMAHASANSRSLSAEAMETEEVAALHAQIDADLVAF